MKRQLRILLTGLLVVVPFAITAWIILAVGAWLDNLGANVILKPLWDAFGLQEHWRLEEVHGVGAVILLVGIYLVGLLMHFWAFRGIVTFLERIFERVPGVKTIYESVRDLMKLFSAESKEKMGRVVEYRTPDSEIGVLGILTNEQPAGAGDEGRSAVYFPMAYMIGGPVVFVKTEHLREVDMPVERALRLCATAHVSAEKDIRAAIESVAEPPAGPKRKSRKRNE